MKASRIYRYKINKKAIHKHKIKSGVLFWDSKAAGTYRKNK